MRGHQNRVHREVGVRAVAALAGDFNRDTVGGGHHRPGIDADGARWQRGPVVHGVNRLHRKTLEQPVLDHRVGPATALFGGLKNQHRIAHKMARSGQIMRRANQHGGVAVVAAAVHQAGFAGLPAERVVLGHGQRVHVGAQADHRPQARVGERRMRARQLPLDDGDDAGFANPRVNLVHAAQLERMHDAAGGVHLFKTQLGMRVKVTAKCSQLGVVLGDMRKGAATGAQRRGVRRTV